MKVFNITSILFAFCALLSAITPARALEGQQVILRSQWKSPHFGDGLITLLGKNTAGAFDEGGTGALYNYTDMQGCESLLNKLFEFPLQKMRAQSYISDAEYQFYSKMGTKLDSRQIVFLNLTEVSSRNFVPGKSIITNLLEAFDASTESLLNRSIRGSREWLNAKSSMWVVRGQVPDMAEGLVKKPLPWKLEPELEKFKKELPQSKIEFEFGRAAKDDETTYETLVKTGAHVAAHDALAAGVALTDARIYIHTLSDKVSRQMRIGYGFKEVGEKVGENHLLSTTVSELLQKDLGPELFHNGIALKKALPDASVEELLRVEHALKSNSVHILDDTRGDSGQWILLANQNQGPYLHDALQKINPKFKVMALTQTPFRLDKIMMGGTDHTHFLALNPGNDFGVSNLSLSQLKKEPRYIERILYEINGYHKELNRSVSAHNPFNIVLDRNYRITTPHRDIAEKARTLGANIKKSVGPGHSMVDIRGPLVTVNEAKNELYEIYFTSDQVKKIVREYSLEASGKSLKRNYHQRVYDAINNL